MPEFDNSLDVAINKVMPLSEAAREGQVGYLLKKYGESVPKEIIAAAVDLSPKNAEKLVIGFQQGVIDTISPEALEAVSGIETKKKAGIESKIQYLIPIVSRTLKLDDAESSELIRQVASFDPTKTKKYIRWVIGQVAKRRIDMWPVPADGPRLLDTLTKFEGVKEKKEFKQLLQKKAEEAAAEDPPRKFPNSTDIEEFNFRQLESLMDEVAGVQIQSKAEKLKDLKRGADLVYDDGKHRVLSITTPEAAVVYGRGTKWCTTMLSKNYDDARYGKLPLLKLKQREDENIIGDLEGYPVTAAMYLQRGPLYIIFKKDPESGLNRAYFQARGDWGELKNIKDQDIDNVGPSLDFFLWQLQNYASTGLSDSAKQQINWMREKLCGKPDYTWTDREGKTRMRPPLEGGEMPGLAEGVQKIADSI